MDYIDFWGCNPGKKFFFSMHKVNKTGVATPVGLQNLLNSFWCYIQRIPVDKITEILPEVQHHPDPFWLLKSQSCKHRDRSPYCHQGSFISQYPKAALFLLWKIMDSFMNLGHSFHPETVTLHLYLLLYQVGLYLDHTFLWYNSFKLSNLVDIVSCPRYLWTASCVLPFSF